MLGSIVWRVANNLNDTGDLGMASLDFNTEKQVFLEFYESQLGQLLNFAAKIKQSLEGLFKDLPESEGFQVSFRIKDKYECIEKFIRKYKKDCEKNRVEYVIQDYISDLIGLRVVCIYINQIEVIKKLLIDEFEMLGETDKIAQMQATENIFGYQALHMDMKLKGSSLGLRDYQRYSGLKFEIQVRTIIQDSWSVVDHKIKYKKEIPLELKRKINILSALFELADREFMTIHDQNMVLVQKKQSEILTEIINPHPSSSILDFAAFSTFLQNKFPEQKINQGAVKKFFNELYGINSEINLAFLVSLFQTNVEPILAYQREQNLDLYVLTFLRHMFFLADQDKYASILFDHQKLKFRQWIQKKPLPYK